MIAASKPTSPTFFANFALFKSTNSSAEIAGNKFSLHYHILKKESWYVAKGSFEYIWINTEKGEEKQTTLTVGQCITIDRGEPHQLIAIEDNSEIFEVSTQHFDEDSYRIRIGDK